MNIYATIATPAENLELSDGESAFVGPVLTAMEAGGDFIAYYVDGSLEVHFWSRRMGCPGVLVHCETPMESLKRRCALGTKVLRACIAKKLINWEDRTCFCEPQVKPHNG